MSDQYFLIINNVELSQAGPADVVISWRGENDWRSTKAGTFTTDASGFFDPVVTIPVPAAGKYIVTADDGCGCPFDKTMYAVVVIQPDAQPDQPDPTPPAMPVIIGADGVCAGTQNNYAVDHVEFAKSYTWSAPAGWVILSGQGTAEVLIAAGAAAQAGNITVYASGDAGNSPAATLAVTVAPGKPVTPGKILGSPLAAPHSAGYKYSVPPVVRATGYTWGVPEGWAITAGQGTPDITATSGAPGSGVIAVIASNGCGNSAPSMFNVSTLGKSSPVWIDSGIVPVVDADGRTILFAPLQPDTQAIVIDTDESKMITQFEPITDQQLNNDALLWVVGDSSGLLYKPTVGQMKKLFGLQQVLDNDPVLTHGNTITTNFLAFGNTNRANTFTIAGASLSLTDNSANDIFRLASSGITLIDSNGNSSYFQPQSISWNYGANTFSLYQSGMELKGNNANITMQNADGSNQSYIAPAYLTVAGANAYLGVGPVAAAPFFSVTNSGVNINVGLYVTKRLFDSKNNPGAAGQILSSNGTGVEWVAAPSGGGGGTTYGFSNGLTENPAGTVKLGGTLNQNTIIDGGTFNTAFQNNSDVATVSINNNGSTGNALNLSSVGGFALTTSGANQNIMTRRGGAVNTANILLDLQYLPTGNGADGIGGIIQFYTKSSTGGQILSTQLISKLTDATALVGEFSIKNAGSVGTCLALKGNGQLQLNKYGLGNMNGTPLKYLAVDGSGNVVESGFTPGSVLFGSTTGGLAQDNAQFYWNDSTNKLALGNRGAGIEPDSLATLYNGDLRVINGAAYFLATNDQTGTGVAINVPTAANPYVQAIKIDHPTMSMFFQNGNADGQAGIRKPALNFGGNEGVLEIYSNAVVGGGLTGQAIISLRTAGVERLNINQAGKLRFNNYGSVAPFTGTAKWWLAVDAAGNVIEMAAPSGGGATPTLQAVATAGSSFSDANGTLTLYTYGTSVTTPGSNAFYSDSGMTARDTANKHTAQVTYGGIAPPFYTTAERDTDLFSVVMGSIIWNSTLSRLQYRSPANSNWIDIGADEKYQAFSDAATITFDCNISINFVVNGIAGNRTLAFTNLKEGKKVYVKFISDAAGNRNVIFPALTKMPLGTGGWDTTTKTLALSSAGGAEDYISVWKDETGNLRAALAAQFV